MPPTCRNFGLRGVDQHAGCVALEAMLGSDERCALFPGGCSSVSQWLGETASYLLGRPMTDPRRRGAMPEVPPEPKGRREEQGRLGRFLERILSRL